MAKTKGFDPPVKEPTYKDESGVWHYLGELIRMTIGEQGVSPRDPEVDILTQSRRVAIYSLKGVGTINQEPYRTAFKDCTILWNTLPYDCPDLATEPPTTAKESIWNAKLDFGVVCSYYDLFLRCCILWVMNHDGALPDGDCFPCVAKCIEDPDMLWDEDASSETISRSSSVVVAIEGFNSPFTWDVSGLGFSLEFSTTECLSNMLFASDEACGTAFITVTGCDDRVASGQVRCVDDSDWVWVSDDDVDPCWNDLNCLPDDPTCPQTASGVYTCEVVTGNTKKIYSFKWLACGSTPCYCECDMGDPPCWSPTGDCKAYKSSNYEWQCV